jgi:hypothetical protein
MAGARAKVIARLTDVPLNKISQLYRALRGTNPPPGPVMQGHARFFAIPSKYTSEAWSVQSAILLSCYDRMGKVLEEPAQRGWQFLASYSAYLILTEKLHHTESIKRLDINQAYALLTHSGFLTQMGGEELRRKECPTCSISYPIVTTEDLSIQACPVCSINNNLLRLAWQSSPSRRRKRARQSK